MLNLLGDLWQDGTPPWEKILALPGCHLHLYGKNPAVVGRKMGHLTITGKTTGEVEQRASQVRSLLGGNK
jgi:5-(carboxyamino)imidazole ribonucleotide synthase